MDREDGEPLLGFLLANVWSRSGCNQVTMMKIKHTVVNNPRRLGEFHETTCSRESHLLDYCSCNLHWNNVYGRTALAVAHHVSRVVTHDCDATGDHREDQISLHFD
jgi:hypothetical protein